MATDDVFAGYEDALLIVKNDDSDYYVPQYEVMTLTQLCPGEAYGVFLSGGDGIDFTYPMGVAFDSNHAPEIVNNNTLSGLDVDVTGESHLFIIEGLEGAKEGDQLRAYDNQGKRVGAINITQEHLDYSYNEDTQVREGSVIDLVIHTAPSYLEDFGIDLNGCSNSQVELKLYSTADDKEYDVSTEVNGACSDSNPAGFNSLGRAEVNPGDVQVSTFKLAQNYPNPFNPTTVINYNVEAGGHVTLKVYDIMGRLVKTLVNDYKAAGNGSGYNVVWDGTDNSGSHVSAGLYIYSLQTGNKSMTKKMVLMK